MFIHQQSATIMFHCFFGENLSEFEIAWEVISLLLELLQNVMKQKDEAFAKVVWKKNSKPDQNGPISIWK